MLEEFKELKRIFLEGYDNKFGYFEGYITDNIHFMHFSCPVYSYSKRVFAGENNGYVVYNFLTVYVIALGSNGICDKFLKEQEYVKIGLHGKWHLIKQSFVDGYGYLFKHNGEVFLLFDKKTVVIS